MINSVSRFNPENRGNEDSVISAASVLSGFDFESLIPSSETLCLCASVVK